MSFDPGRLGALLGQSVIDPAGVARQLLALRLDRGTLWSALLLVTVLSVLLVALTQGPAPELPAGQQVVVVSPFTYATILGASLVLLVFALQFTGAALGGQGELGGALILVVWLEVLAMALRLVQGVAMLVLPPLVGPVTLVGMGILLWALVNFINVLHGFENLWKAVFTLALAIVGIGLGLALILAVIGVGAGGV